MCRKFSLCSALLVCSALLLLSRAAAAGVLGSIPVDLGAGRVLVAPMGTGPGEQFGNAVASAGDVNGDGYEDVIVAAWTSDAVAGDAGSAYVYFGGPGADDVPDLILHGEGYADNFGSWVASAGDMNGDGFGDLIVGAWQRIAPGSRTGRAYIYYGGPGVDAIPDIVLTGAATDDRFGIMVSCAGDLNGDGFSDVIVGAPCNDAGGVDAGRAYVYFGGAIPNGVPDVMFTGAAGDSLGWRVSGAGDVNSDGFPDIVVGAPGAAGRSGRAYVYYGGPGLDAVADRVLVGEAAGDNFGISVASAGDVNGDGDDDLIIGAWTNDANGTNAGRAYLFYGGAGSDAVADLTLTGEAAGDLFGFVVSSAGDLNRDGFGDLIVGAITNDAHGTSAGRVYVYHGGPGADGIADMTLTGEGAGDRLGFSAAAAGDFDADGVADVIVGAYFNDANGSDAGRAYVVTASSDRPPVVSAPVTITGNEGTAISFSVTVSDPDGDAIGSLTAMPLPPGAAFTPNGSNTVGALTWTPTYGDAGTYDVTFTASNSLLGRATTRISVTNTDRPPVVDPIASQTAAEGTIVDVPAHASDPDGDRLTLSLAAPPFASLILESSGGPGDVAAVIHLAPGFDDAGVYLDNRLTATGGTISASASFGVTVANVNRPPVVTSPLSVTSFEGSLIAFLVVATDPDGDPVTLSVQGLPLGATWIDSGAGTGSFSWTPGYGQAGTHIVSFLARDDQGASSTPRSVTISVGNLNRAPAASAGGPYSGVVNVPVSLIGTSSWDPDGDPLTFSWNFGDLATGVGPTPIHAYSSGGVHVVTLTVSDGLLSNTTSTSVTIQDVFPARAFTTGGNKTIHLGSGKATWCTQVEPVGGSYLSTSVISSTITMKYGTGQIFALGGKVSIGADKDGNGVQELTACFAKTDLRTLFADLPKGTNTVTVTLEGDLSSGGKFRGTLTVDVVSTGGTLVASLSPNPLRPEGTLTLHTDREGALRVTVFDLSGRVVRVLHDASSVAPGYHDMRIDGRDSSGRRLASGVYFYRIEAAEGVETGRFVIAR